MNSPIYNIVQIGCGVVGKAYVDAYKKVGCNVIGIEASMNLINKYKNEFTMYHVDDDMSKIINIDFVMISICTPLKNDKLDLSYLFSSIKNVAQIVKNNPNVLVVLRSTVPPGTTRKYKQELEDVCHKLMQNETDININVNVNVLFQPEFLRAVSAVEDAINPWHIVVGVDNNTDISKLLDLYTRFISREQISILNIEESELLKIYHNSFNAMKISYMNHCDTLNKCISSQNGVKIDTNKINETIVKTCEGLRNPKYGTKAGHAYYGTCLPKDSAELASLEKQYGLNVPLFDCVVKVNDEIKKMDKEEVLVGDFHVPHTILMNQKN